MNTLKQPEKQGFRDFDLPKEHLSPSRHYVPPKTHDLSEAIRRRELTPGTLVAEQQARGLRVAHTILTNLTDQDGLIFATNTLAATGLNSAWYSYAQKTRDVMRRRLKLPIMLHERSRTSATLLEDAVTILGNAGDEAGKLVSALEYNPRKVGDHQREVGQRTGNCALRLACYEAVTAGDFEDLAPTDEALQAHVRDIAIDALSTARSLHTVVGSHPSIAQLSDPYSHLSVYWHRKAPGSAQTAVVDAIGAVTN